MPERGARGFPESRDQVSKTVPRALTSFWKRSDTPPRKRGLGQEPFCTNVLWSYFRVIFSFGKFSCTGNVLSFPGFSRWSTSSLCAVHVTEEQCGGGILEEWFSRVPGTHPQAKSISKFIPKTIAALPSRFEVLSHIVFQHFIAGIFSGSPTVIAAQLCSSLSVYRVVLNEPHCIRTEILRHFGRILQITQLPPANRSCNTHVTLNMYLVGELKTKSPYTTMP